VAGELAHLLRKQQMDAFTAQEASGMGPLTSMNHIELRHWMSEACMVVQAAAACGPRAHSSVNPGSRARMCCRSWCESTRLSSGHLRRCSNHVAC
jgi:hypothetical protein